MPPTCTAISTMLLLAACARGASYDESVSGDLSNDRFAPTMIQLHEGSNRVTGSVTFLTLTQPTDLDYFSVAVPPGKFLTSIQLEALTIENGRAFLGMQSGTAITFSESYPAASDFLGYVHFSYEHLGVDLLPVMAAEFGVVSFSTPLAAGNYSFWVNQTEPSPTTYTLNFLVPEPASLSLLALATSLVCRRRVH